MPPYIDIFKYLTAALCCFCCFRLSLSCSFPSRRTPSLDSTPVLPFFSPVVSEQACLASPPQHDALVLNVVISIAVFCSHLIGAPTFFPKSPAKLAKCSQVRESPPNAIVLLRATRQNKSASHWENSHCLLAGCQW